MNTRRTFLSRIAVGLAAIPAFAFAKRQLEHKGVRSLPVWKGDINDQHMQELARVVQQALNNVVEECQRDGANLKTVRVDWFNILSKFENPMGEVGHFQIVFEREV